MRKYTALLVFLVSLIFISQVCYAQKVFLRHKFSPGESAKAQTIVKLQGDSLFSEEKGSTNCFFNFTKQYLVNQVSEDGTGDFNLTINQIRVQGAFESQKLNEDYSGAKLKKLMANSEKIRVQISPDGVVKGNDSLPLAQMGISMPMQPSTFGGFEFPTFPMESVQPGTAWTESGTILRGKDLTSSNNEEGVYSLQKITTAGSYGRTAVIRYKKTTDFGGLSLGSAGNSAVSALAGSTGIGELSIQLEGEILFAIDKGIVLKSTQSGFISLQKSNPAGNKVNRFQVQQKGLKLYTQTNFDWSNVQQNSPSFMPQASQQNQLAKQPRLLPQSSQLPMAKTPMTQPPVSPPQVTQPQATEPQEFPPPKVEKVPEENQKKKDN